MDRCIICKADITKKRKDAKYCDSCKKESYILCMRPTCLKRLNLYRRFRFLIELRNLNYL